MATISGSNLISQSPYLYLQGAGSDGSDGSMRGVHLRWDFGEGLAENHIPKGNLAASGKPFHTTAGFNKADDFVKIYRTQYDRNFPAIVDFANMLPELIDNEQTWIYKNLRPVRELPDNTCNVVVRFADKERYNELRAQYNPNETSERLSFLKNYDKVFEVEVENRLMFAARLQMQAIDSSKESTTRIESISRTNKPDAPLFISSRKKCAAGTDGDAFLLKEDTGFLLQENNGLLKLERAGASSGIGKVMAENIQYIRFRGENTFPVMLWLETYYDFWLGKNELSDWKLKTKLSLSIENNEVFERLEQSGQIDRYWTKFMNGAAVKTENYKTRWTTGNETNESLFDGVKSYLDWSRDEDNLAAFNPIDSNDPPEERFSISYLAFLKLVAYDFHIARMLGFGYIDADIQPNTTDKYMYIAVYDIPADFEGVQKGTHTFMTLPVGETDYKLPAAPELLELKYGLFMNDESEIPMLLTDERGYSRYDNSRAINLHVKPFTVTLAEVVPFYDFTEEFDYVSKYTEPIQFGIAYKNSNDPEWRRPELSNDRYFQDHQGKNETVPIFRLATETDRIYTHIETEEGIHEYAVYGINWFSRISPLSNIRQTDKTVFSIRNTLVPPLNLGVQLIQKEDPLIFTTAAEQKRLNEISTDDKTLVRLTFEWNHINASNYWYGKEAEFFFREEPLIFVRGKIKSVEDLETETGLFKIRTESYYILSTNPRQTIKPVIAPEEENRFVNSFLSVNGGEMYEVQNVKQSDNPNEGAIFTIRAPENRGTVMDDDGILHIVNAPAAPEVGSIFSVAENISLREAWNVKLTQKVTLKKFSDYYETDIDSEDNRTEINIGGIYEKASITEILDINDEGSIIPDSKTGIYRIIFNDYVLEPHENPNVEWYKGSVRVKVMRGSEEEVRVLDVWDIERNPDNMQKEPLRLIVFDSTFAVNENDNLKPEYIPIPTGEDIDVNYHPGYRVYFTHETGFNQQSILPKPGAGSRQTLIACRSTDPDLEFGSPLSTPAVILAREIIEPVAPHKPTGGLFATRPNFYGKASYTFDTQVNTENSRTPYALVFYRANEQAILDALYEHDTVLQIQEDLAQIGDDAFLTDRWNELVNVDIRENAQFSEWNGYRFPNPDNSAFRIPNREPETFPVFEGFNRLTNPGNNDFIDGTEEFFGEKKTYRDIVKLAINNAFLSLTEQPVLYRFLNRSHQTSDRQPVTRDSNGNLIIPGNPEYDGSPMAVRLPNSGIVRFTDYTLDGASNSIFFYYAVEMNNTLTMSERSPILGPIQLNNTAPPKAPEIRSFYTRPENTVTGDTTAVLFEINEYPEGEKINEILIYRTFDSIDALSVRTMKLAAAIDIDTNEPIIDDFSDLDYYPFGEVLYYRLAAVRKVRTDNNMEEVHSYPSSLILANIIDVNNPEAPELFYSLDEENSTEELLENVVVKWKPTAYNGTYYLYQMNDSGNWNELAKIENRYSPMQYEIGNLPKTDEDGRTVFYRFKVMVENSSGLFSLEERVLTI